MIGTSIPPSAGVGGRRLPQPPPEAQTALAMTSVTPLPMGQKPVPLSFRNRKLPKVPTSQPTNVGIGVPAPSRLPNIGGVASTTAQPFNKSGGAQVQQAQGQQRG